MGDTDGNPSLNFCNTCMVLLAPPAVCWN